jgi:hypothetical protein
MKGIWFDDIHTYDNLNLVLSKVDIPPATPKTNFIDIPGGDGSVDLTEALGEVRYKDRECSFTFTVMPTDNFEEKKKEISNLLNGKRCKIVLDKDPGYYWEGRCSVNDYASNKNIHQIVVGATVAPYKLKTQKTTVSVPAGENVTVTLSNSRRTVIPIITNTDDATIVFSGNRYDLKAGTHTVLNIALIEGANTLTVTSLGTVKFTYQEEDL